jgi:hypothetical protein
MAVKDFVGERKTAISGIVVSSPKAEPELIQPPVYTVPGVQEGREITSFARPDAEERLPQEAAFFIIPKGDKDLIEAVAKAVARASSPEDKIFDVFLHYVAQNPERVKTVTMTREQAVAEALRISQGKGTVVQDDFGARIKGMYKISAGFLFAHRAETTSGEEENEEEELILEATDLQLASAPDVAALESQEKQLPASELANTVGYEVVKLPSNDTTGQITAPGTQTLDKPLPKVNITKPLQKASKIIAFIYEEEMVEKKVESPEVKQVTAPEPQSKPQTIPAAPIANPFAGAIPDFNKYVTFVAEDSSKDRNN